MDENIGKDVIGKVLIVLDKDRYINAQESLNSTYKREQFIQKHFKMVLPKEIVLNPDDVRRGKQKDSYMYVSVIESVKTLFEDKTFNRVLEKQRNMNENKDGDLLLEVRDGSLIRNIPYYQENPDSFVGGHALFRCS